MSAPKTLEQLIAEHTMLQDVQCGVSVGDGWVPMLHVLCRQIEHHCESAKLALPTVMQVKEKFGTLRFYLYGTDLYTQGLVSMAEAVSSVICEDCGAVGEGRDGSWLRTLCDACEVTWKARTR